VSPANIPYQGNTTLFWFGPQGATYTIQYMANGQVVNVPGQGDPPLGNNGQYPGQGKPALTLETTTVFTMNVAQSIDNQEFHAQQQVTVSVVPPPPPKPRITKFHGSVAIDETQLQLTLSWITDLANQVTITNINGLQKPSDTLVIKPTQSDPLASTYTLEARKGAEAPTSTISIIWTGYKSAKLPGLAAACALLPNATRLYCLGLTSNNVTALDPTTLANLPGSPYPVPNPVSIAASPDSARVYVNQLASDKQTLKAYDAATFTAVGPAASIQNGAAILA
jgi:hypothetical protein